MHGHPAAIGVFRASCGQIVRRNAPDNVVRRANETTLPVLELRLREPQRYSRLSSHLFPPSIQWDPVAQVIEMFPISPSSPHVVEAMPFDASHAAKRREEKTGTLSIIQRTREARHTSHFEKKLSNFGSTPMSLWPSPQSIVGRT